MRDDSTLDQSTNDGLEVSLQRRCRINEHKLDEPGSTKYNKEHTFTGRKNINYYTSDELPSVVLPVLRSQNMQAKLKK